MKVISTAPSRLSLFGGGTDLPEYYEKQGGIVLSMAINLRSKVEFYTKDSKWEHASTRAKSADFPYGCNPDLYYSILKTMGVNGQHASRSTTSFDGVIGAGLGSSASFAAALIIAIKRSKGETIDKIDIAELAWEAEENIGKTGGKQDQFATVFGGFNEIIFPTFGEIKVIPFERKLAEKVASYMTLFYVGGTRESSKLQKTLTKQTKEQINVLGRLKEIAYYAQKAILDKNMILVGELLDMSWTTKKLLNKKISSSKIDDIYSYARKNGAMGGKLCGAGESGYMMFMVEPRKRKEFLAKMKEKNLEETDFSIDWTGTESRII